jgi:hypothetical protein
MGDRMTVDLEEKKTNRTDALNSGSVWYGDERRKRPRTGVDDVGYLSSGGASTRCRVLNISADGAAIDVPSAAYVPDCFELMTERDRLIRKCRIVWIRQNRIGVAFEKNAEPEK